MYCNINTAKLLKYVREFSEAYLEPSGRSTTEFFA